MPPWARFWVDLTTRGGIFQSTASGQPRCEGGAPASSRCTEVPPEPLSDEQTAKSICPVLLVALMAALSGTNPGSVGSTTYCPACTCVAHVPSAALVAVAGVAPPLMCSTWPGMPA